MIKITLCVSVGLQTSLEPPGCNLKLAPILGGQGENEERGSCSRLVDGRFNKQGRDFPGGPVVRTPGFHCRGRGFDPLSGN